MRPQGLASKHGKKAVSIPSAVAIPSLALPHYLVLFNRSLGRLPPDLLVRKLPRHHMQGLLERSRDMAREVQAASDCRNSVAGPTELGVGLFAKRGMFCVTTYTVWHKLLMGLLPVGVESIWVDVLK